MDGRDFETILTEYRPDLRPTNRRPRTIGNYERTLGRWRAWVESRADEPATVADVEKRHVAGYLDACRGHEAPETVLTGHRHLRAFLKWCESARC